MNDYTRVLIKLVGVFVGSFVIIVLVYVCPEYAGEIITAMFAVAILYIIGMLIYAFVLIVKPFIEVFIIDEFCDSTDDIDSKKHGIYNIEEYNGYEFFGRINKKRVKRIAICPKIREQLYRVPKGVFLNIYAEINGRALEQVKVVRTYNKNKDTIRVLDCKNKYNIFKSKLTLKAEDVFWVLGINNEMTSLDFYFEKFDNYVYDGVSILPKRDSYDTNKFFKYYDPFEDNRTKKDTFIKKVKDNEDIADESDINYLFNFFDNKVSPLMFDACMSYIAIHEYSDLAENESAKREKKEMYRFFKMKLPWIDDETIDWYLECVLQKKGAYIEYKDRYLEMKAVEVYALENLRINENVVNGMSDKELTAYVKDIVEEDCRFTEFAMFKKEYLKNKIRSLFRKKNELVN